MVWGRGKYDSSESDAQNGNSTDLAGFDHENASWN